MKDKILNYINQSKIRYTTYIRRDTELLGWIEKQIGLDIDLKEKVYLIINDLSSLPKCPCGNSVKFIGLNEGYTRFCSKKCPEKHKDRITAAQEFYKEEENKAKAVNKLKETMVSKYGVFHNSGLPEVIKKREKTWNEKYGCSNPAKSEIVKEKIKETNLERYQAASPLGSEIIREKIKRTNLAKYGVENSLQSSRVKNKIYSTNLAKYGSIYSTQRHYSKIQLETLNDKEGFLNFCKKHPNTTSAIKDLGIDRTTFLKYIKNYDLFNQLSYNFFSYPESKIKEFLDSLDLEVFYNKRKIIDNFELDVFLPNFMTAIEVNGLYFHSEYSGSKNSFYHYQKTKSCLDKGIQLFHIWDNEIYDEMKFSIWKRKILMALGIGEKGQGARKFEIREIGEEYARFLEENHIQGTCPAKYKIGAFYEGKLEAVMAFNKTKQGWELVRWCVNKNNPGLFSKMLKFSANHFQIDYIYTYADLRYSYGDVYKKNGFIEEKFIGPTYYYTDYSRLWHRSNFMKSKIKEKFNIEVSNKTEKELMLDLGYDRVWDAGKIRFGKYF